MKKKGEKLNDITVRSIFYLKNVKKYKFDESISHYEFDIYFNDNLLTKKMIIMTYSIEGLRKEVMELISIILDGYFN